MEIERKWLVDAWPQGLPLLFEQMMRQGYVSVSPTVRIRQESMTGGSTEYILCFKSAGGIARKEIEMAVPEDIFGQLEDLIGLPLIPKTRRTYALPDGHHLEVSVVDEGMDTAFMYAEVEFDTVEQALAWQPSAAGLGEYLNREVTEMEGQSMGAYWLRTRAGAFDC